MARAQAVATVPILRAASPVPVKKAVRRKSLRIKKGAAAKAAKAARVARAASKADRAVKAVRGAKVANKAVNQASKAALKGAVRKGAAVRAVGRVVVEAPSNCSARCSG